MLASRNTWSTEKIFRILSKILSFSVILIPFKNFCSWTPCKYNYLLWYWVFHPIWWEFFSNLWQESYLSTEDLHFQKLPENQQKPIFHYSPDSNTCIWYLTQYWFSVLVSVYGSPSLVDSAKELKLQFWPLWLSTKWRMLKVCNSFVLMFEFCASDKNQNFIQNFIHFDTYLSALYLPCSQHANAYHTVHSLLSF